MERFTISLGDELAADFDRLIEETGYENRSEAVRDLIRQALEKSRIESNKSKHCIAVVSYVYNHHEKTMADRLMNAQHEHHNIVMSTMHAHLDHDNCMEAVFLKGRADAVREFAGNLTAMSGIRHGAMNLISANVTAVKHSHGHGLLGTHTHLKPKN
jgi:CopG family nickel-responsive transcriptional regulator